MFWLKARKLRICKGLSIEKCNVTKVTPFLGFKVVHVLFYLVSLLYCKVTDLALPRTTAPASAAAKFSEHQT